MIQLIQLRTQYPTFIFMPMLYKPSLGIRLHSAQQEEQCHVLFQTLLHQDTKQCP